MVRLLLRFGRTLVGVGSCEMNEEQSGKEQEVTINT